MNHVSQHQGEPIPTQGTWTWFLSIPRRVANIALDKKKTATDHSVRIGEVTVRERQEQLAEFYNRYEDLVELLCDSAQYGPNAHLEEKYQAIRSWMQRNYGSLSQVVIAYLDIEVADTRMPMDLYGRSTDAFEALYAAPTLQEQLRSDDGSMIGRIMRTREALNRYAEQLRRLAA